MSSLLAPGVRGMLVDKFVSCLVIYGPDFCALWAAWRQCSSWLIDSPM